jgi:polyphosphate kinase
MAASNVMFGIPGLKVHSKLLLVQRREEGGDRYYTHIGTGNFNEKTARLYTDFSLLTYDQASGARCARCLNSCATPTVA